MYDTQVILESGKRFFASKMSNSDSPHVFTPIGFISKKKLFHVGGTYFVVAPKNFMKYLFKSHFPMQDKICVFFKKILK
jgi:hypothetical protein